jgi:hypothetical protein
MISSTGIPSQNLLFDSNNSNNLGASDFDETTLLMDNNLFLMASGLGNINAATAVGASNDFLNNIQPQNVIDPRIVSGDMDEVLALNLKQQQQKLSNNIDPRQFLVDQGSSIDFSVVDNNNNNNSQFLNTDDAAALETLLLNDIPLLSSSSATNSNNTAPNAFPQQLNNASLLQQQMMFLNPTNNNHYNSNHDNTFLIQQQQQPFVETTSQQSLSLDDFYQMGSIQQQLYLAASLRQQQQQQFEQQHLLQAQQQHQQLQYVPINVEPRKRQPEVSNHERFSKIKQRIERLDFQDVTVLELKSLLRECGVSACGKKHVLVAKLKHEYNILCQKLKLADIPWIEKKKGGSNSGAAGSNRFVPF